MGAGIELPGRDAAGTPGGGLWLGGGRIGCLPQGGGKTEGGTVCEKHLRDFPGKPAVGAAENDGPGGAVRAGDSGARAVGGLVFRNICP